MFKKILAMLRGSPAASLESKSRPLESDTSPDNATPPARWLIGDDPGNPFILDGFDCYGFVSSMLSTTKDPEIAKSFVSLRSADGAAMRGMLPDDSIDISCSLSYDYDGEILDGVLFKSAVMEEKWDIYLYDNRVYFCRSWTGALALVAEITPMEKSLQISRVWAPRSGAPALAVQQVDYLIKSHLYRQRVPHPLPQELGRDPGAVAMYSFSQYGRLCCFGSFENTLGKVMLKSNPDSAPDA